MTSSDDSRSRRWLWSAAAALLLLHLAMLAPLQGPMLFGDEAAYPGMARFLAGRAPDLRLASPELKHGAFLATGYSVVLLPAGLLEDPLATYRAALVLNAICAAAGFLVLAAFAHRVLGLPPPRAILAGLVASLYPAALLLPKLSWSESLLTLLVLALPLAFLRLAERRTLSAAVLFGALAGASYWVHQRTLPLLALSLLALALLARRRTLTAGTALAGAAALLLPAIAGRLTNVWVWERLSSRGTPLSEAGLLASLLRPEGLWQSFLSTIGQLWYLAAATAGMALLGVWALARIAAERSWETPRRQAAAFALATGAGLFALSAAFVIVPDRVDKLFYGRYWEPALGLFLAAAVARLMDRPRPATFALALAPLALGALLVTLRGGNAFQGLFNELNVLGVAPWTLAFGQVRILWISALTGAVGLMVLALARWRPAAGAWAVALLFAGGSLYVHGKLLVPLNRGAQTTLRIPERLGEMPSAVAVAYDEGHLTERTFYAYPFRISGMRLLWFDSRDAASPAPLVISALPWPEAPPGARLVFPENVTRQALWVLPGEVQDRLAAAGALFPEDLTAPLPPEACRARFTREDGADGPLRVASGEEISIPLRLAHAGTGSPWIAAPALPSPERAVRIGIRWMRDGTLLSEHRAELPWSMAPGEEAGVDLSVEAPRLPGPYEIKVSLIQELVRWCDGPDDGVLTLPVEVADP